MTDGETLDEAAFLAAAAADGGRDVEEFFRWLFDTVRSAGMGIDRGAAPTPTAVGWCVLDGTPSIIWVATTGGAGGTPGLELWLTELLARVAVSPYREIVLALFVIPLVQQGLEANGTRAVLEVGNLVANPNQSDQMLSVLAQIAEAGRSSGAAFRTPGGLYSWGERGEHGG